VKNSTYEAYLLDLADNAPLGQSVAERGGHGKVLEEAIAMADIGLDQIGQARMLCQHAAPLICGRATENSLANLRNTNEFLNDTLLELPQPAALDDLIPYTQEFFTTAAFESEAIKSGTGLAGAYAGAI
jgi:1,2-phenylacetyl-CoA epoxidase catalytic subunit